MNGACAFTVSVGTHMDSPLNTTGSTTAAGAAAANNPLTSSLHWACKATTITHGPCTTANYILKEPLRVIPPMRRNVFLIAYGITCNFPIRAMTTRNPAPVVVETQRRLVWCPRLVIWAVALHSKMNPSGYQMRFRWDYVPIFVSLSGDTFCFTLPFLSRMLSAIYYS